MAVAMAGMVGLVASTAIAVAGMGAAYAGRVQAQVAADAAALAAAVATYPPAASVSPSVAASAVAEQNGARLVRCRCPVSGALRARTVEVVAAMLVEVPFFGEVAISASSRAEFDPGRWLGR